MGKLSRGEFESVIDTVHEKVGKFRKYWTIGVISIVLFLAVIAVFVLGLIYFGKDEQDPYSEANGWGIGITVFLYLLGLILVIVCAAWRLVKFDRDC